MPSARRQLKYNVQPDWSNQIITVYLIGQFKPWSDMISFHRSEIISNHCTGIIFSHGFMTLNSHIIYIYMYWTFILFLLVLYTTQVRILDKCHMRVNFVFGSRLVVRVFLWAEYSCIFQRKIRMILFNILESEDSYEDLESIISKVRKYS